MAIKVLPPDYDDVPERLARFEREARLLAALNHPNVAAIHGFEDFEGRRFLVLELVPGETLAERLKAGPLRLTEALDIFRQIAEALEAAHDRGIIHRDLKPANVKITPEGKVKVLDFGLAKALREGPSDAGAPELPTRTDDRTREGMVLGTPAYMRPEQARGRPTDKRTDVWAFGCCLFEALTGRKVFEGETDSDRLAAVLGREPDWSALPDATPARIRSLLRRCLQKDLQKRLRDMGDARIEIEEAQGEASATALPGPGASARPAGRPHP